MISLLHLILQTSCWFLNSLNYLVLFCSVLFLRIEQSQSTIFVFTFNLLFNYFYMDKENMTQINFVWAICARHLSHWLNIVITCTWEQWLINCVYMYVRKVTDKLVSHAYKDSDWQIGITCIQEQWLTNYYYMHIRTMTDKLLSHAYKTVTDKLLPHAYKNNYGQMIWNSGPLWTHVFFFFARVFSFTLLLCILFEKFCSLKIMKVSILDKNIKKISR